MLLGPYELVISCGYHQIWVDLVGNMYSNVPIFICSYGPQMRHDIPSNIIKGSLEDYSI